MTAKEANASRLKLGMTHGEFSSALGVSLRTSENWGGSGKRNPSDENAEKILRLLKEKAK